MGLAEYFGRAAGDLPLLITTVLTLGVILVNGWTDAPNAIAACVSTRSMPIRAAVIMAAACNFAGVAVMTALNRSVAETVMGLVDFGGDDRVARVALCAGLVAIVTWATAAWKFGIPTSESHALIAGLSGAAIALQGGRGIRGSEWVKVLYGLALSTVLGFVLGWLSAKAVRGIFRNASRKAADRGFRGAQIAAGAATAFLHGAQDGQKFIGIFLLGIRLSGGSADGKVPLWLLILCALVMGLGTSIGGYRIIRSMSNMVRMEKYQGFASDVAAAGCLLFSSLTGLPVSTTHTKTSAVMGVGAANRIRSVNWGVAKDMLLTWILTFPGCGMIGFLMAKIFMSFFS